MTTDINDMRIRHAALTAGIALALMTLIAPIAEFSVRQTMIVFSDTTLTIQNIQAQPHLFRLAIFIYLLVAILDVIVALALHNIFKRTNISFSLLTAWLRITYAAVLTVSAGMLITGLKLIDGAIDVSGISENNANVLAMICFSAFVDIWNIGLGIFGVHLLLLGGLILKSTFVPKGIGLLVAIAGVGYLTDTAGRLLVENYAVTVAMFTFIGEVVLIFWLFIKGAKLPDSMAAPPK